MIKNFYDLDAWQKARRFSSAIYKITKNFPKEELFGVTSQLRRAATSICANISEGFGRYHYKDKTRFYYQARGSAQEVQCFLMISLDLEYIAREEYIKLFKESIDLTKVINGLIRSTKGN
ncbi:four helix bundle protein [Candidatus Falkowbacteria bacterium]|nr:four helix bundle protein [Candidatus Falkowbacteria bacterium]